MEQKEEEIRLPAEATAWKASQLKVNPAERKLFKALEYCLSR